MKNNDKMTVALAADHAGYPLKEALIKHLTSRGIDTIDCGTNNTESCDYPDFAYPAACAVKDKKVDFGILVCYTGIGMSMVANKVKGIRAALVTSVENAHLTKEHNNANILCLGAKDTPQDLALNIVDEFINTPFAGGRHERRVNKLMETEE